jgi:hypothetical protein
MKGINRQQNSLNMAKWYRKLCFGCNTWICNDQKISKAVNLVYGMSGKIQREKVFIIKGYNFKVEDVFVQLIFTVVYLNVYLSLCIKQLIFRLVHHKALFSYCHCSFGNFVCYVSGHPGRKYTQAELPALGTPLF